MTAVEATSSPDNFFIDGKALTGARGTLFARSRNAKGDLIAVERLVYKLAMPASHFDLLHGCFTRKELFLFEVHRQLKIVLSVTAVLSKVDKTNDEAACLVEFDMQ
jgi:hypothetical protein